MTAAEKAMHEIGEALEAFFMGSITSEDLNDTIAQINGAYSVERIGEG